MKNLTIIIFLTFLPIIAIGAENSFTDSEGRGFPADYHDVDTKPEKGEGIQKYADDAQSGAPKNFGKQPVHDDMIFAVFHADRLEYQSGEGEGLFLWDVQSWIGEDYNKLWFKSEGTWLTDKDTFEEAEAELFYSRNIATFWDLQIGARHDFKPNPDRTFAAFGVQGLAPLWFEVQSTAYVSEDGDVSASLEAEYDLLLSQRLILQPRLETSIAFQKVGKYGTGQGFNDIVLGLRLRYEIIREFAPYVGVSWKRKLGETADMAQDEGENIDVTSFVIGVWGWF